MEGLKKNIHFVVFGAGVLIGLILMVVGIMIKGGSQEQLVTATTAMPKPGSLPTKSDLDKAKAKRGDFDKQINGAEEALKTGAGAQLRTGRTNYPDGPSFFSQEADASVKALQGRFKKLEKDVTLPAELGGRTLPVPPNQANFWAATLQNMNSIADPKAIPNFQVQIRIMQEVCFVCEELCRQDAFKDDGVKLVEFKFEFRGQESVSIDSPWEDFPFVVVLECQPGFATALVEELANPSKNTNGDPQKAKEGKGRWGFPIEVEGMQMELMERPTVVNLDIANADKTKYGIPDTTKEDDPALLAKKKELEEKWFKEMQIKLPARVGIGGRALAFNKNWRGVTPPPESN